MFDEKNSMLDMGKNCHIIKGVSNNETKVWFMYSSKNSAAHPPTAPKKACFHQKLDIIVLVLNFGTPIQPIFRPLTSNSSLFIFDWSKNDRYKKGLKAFQIFDF